MKKLACGCAVVGVAILSVWLHAKIIHLGYEIDQLQVSKKELLMVNRELQIKISELSSLERIEKIATTRLGMRVPTPEQIIMVHKETES